MSDVPMPEWFAEAFFKAHKQTSDNVLKPGRRSRARARSMWDEVVSHGYVRRRKVGVVAVLPEIPPTYENVLMIPLP